jgi:glycosyltransferase involved in cell wall biosynthesis
MSKSIIFLSDSLPLGGTATFLLNIFEGFSKSSTWSPQAAVLKGFGDVALQINDRGLKVISPHPCSLLHEEIIEDIYNQLSSYSPRAVVASIGGSSFDFLRFVPEDCLRIGMIHSDEEGVYRLVKRYIPWLDIIVCVSTEIYNKTLFLTKGTQTSVAKISCGVPMPHAKAIKTFNKKLRVLYLGRVIEEQKRISILSKVMRRTIDCKLDISWTIAGSGPDLPFLINEFSDNSSCVKFLGSVPYSAVPNLLSQNDVYFLCSDYEGLPLSMLEAMGAGLVPVVSDLASGISEVVNSCNGVRVPIDNEDDYFNAIYSLLENPSRCASLSVNAVHDVKDKYSIGAMTTNWMNLLDDNISVNNPAWGGRIKASVPPEVATHWYYTPWMRPIRHFRKKLISL